MSSDLGTSRRRFLTAAGTAAGALTSLSLWNFGPGRGLAATPACADTGEPTPRQTAGPFFIPKSPQRASLVEPGETAKQLRVSGRVLTTHCKPVPGALLDFWHADARGEYDLQGFRYRGHLFASDDGRFELQTIVPGIYTGRTRHIHVRAQPARGAILTTQLYFPGEPANAWDFLFNPALLMKLSGDPAQPEAAFDFVLKI